MVRYSFSVNEIYLAKSVTLQWVVIKGIIRTVVSLEAMKVYRGSEGIAPFDTTS